MGLASERPAKVKLKMKPLGALAWEHCGEQLENQHCEKEDISWHHEPGPAGARDEALFTSFPLLFSSALIIHIHFIPTRDLSALMTSEPSLVAMGVWVRCVSRGDEWEGGSFSSLISIITSPGWEGLY
ncbi:hypothetical protein SRHO_G00268230 [Serrasalmus rhombeus]